MRFNTVVVGKDLVEQISSKADSQRIVWIDMARGVGIFLVVLGHVVNLPNFFGLYIYTFHLPLFFFLSGYLFKVSKSRSFKLFLKKKAKQLVLPYVLFSMLSFILYIVLNWHYVFDNHIINSQTKDFFIGLFYAVRGTRWTEHSGAVWFLACLFLTEMSFYFIANIIKHNLNSLCKILCVVSVLGYLYFKFYNHPLPWSLDASLVALVFYGLGFLAKETKVLDRLSSNYGVLAVLFMVNFFAGSTNKPVDMFSGSYGNYFLFYISALAGIAMIITLSKIIKERSTLVLMGKNSLAIMGLHYYIGFSLADLILNHLYKGSLFFAINYSSRLIILRDLLGLLLISTGYALFVIIIITPLIYLYGINYLGWFFQKLHRLRLNQHLS